MYASFVCYIILCVPLPTAQACRPIRLLAIHASSMFARSRSPKNAMHSPSSTYIWLPVSVIGEFFVCMFITACGRPRPLFGIRRLAAIRVLPSYCIYGDVSRCIYQRPLFGRCPLLGVSVNRDSTVYLILSLDISSTIEKRHNSHHIS